MRGTEDAVRGLLASLEMTPTGGPLDFSAPISSLGFDSLEFMELIVAAEDEFSVDMFQADFPDDPSLADLVAEIERRIQ